MNFDEKRISKKFLSALAIVNFSIFLLYFINRFNNGDSAFADIAKIVLFLIKDMHKTIMPMLIAAAALITYAEHGRKSAVLKLVAYASTWIAYSFPYYAFYFADGGLLIGDVFIMTALMTLGTLVILTLAALIIFIFIIFITKRFALRHDGRYDFSRELKKHDAQDFSLPITVGIFSGALLLLLSNIGIELGYYTIPYLIETSGTYRTCEIIYMAFRYVYILILFLICYFGAHRIKKIYK